MPEVLNWKLFNVQGSMAEYLQVINFMGTDCAFRNGINRKKGLRMHWNVSGHFVEISVVPSLKLEMNSAYIGLEEVWLCGFYWNAAVESF
jgi:hypothetical protein